ncbi:MAG: hypothetical protein Q9216_000558 [Gyalolechia sp. 2 TL-2023]
MSASDGENARLILTFFAKARHTYGGSKEDFKSQSLACGPTFSQLLTPQVAPALLNLESSQTLAPGIFQSVYTISPPFLKTEKLRRHASVTAFEALHSLEIIFDLIFNPPPDRLRPVRLAVFDMDSTLINEEVIDELARSIGITSAVSAITARAMNGEIEFEQSLRERLRLLKGVRADVWEELKKSVTIATGAKELIKYIRERGVITVVVSGGFAPMALWLKEQLGLDHAFANHLVTAPPSDAYPYPYLAGDLSPEHPIVTPEYKRQVLESTAKEHSVPLSETFVVGDGSNDLLMLGSAGLGIAWRAKERVQREAPQRLNGSTLSDLIFVLGGQEMRHG